MSDVLQPAEAEVSFPSEETTPAEATVTPEESGATEE